MKQNHIFNIIWWLASPFFIVFFFLVLLLFLGNYSYLNSFLYLTLFLVTLPLIIDWFVAVFIEQDGEIRPKVSTVVFLLDFIAIYIFYISKLNDFTHFLYIIFSFQVIVSFVLRLFNQNQYVYLLAVFLAVVFIFSMLTFIDLFYLVLILLFISGLLIMYFIKFKYDSLKSMLIQYSVGVGSTAILAFILSLFISF